MRDKHRVDDKMRLDEYLEEDELGKTRERFRLFNEMIESPERYDFPELDDISKRVLREIMIQPMATSWWVNRNLRKKYGLELSVKELEESYKAIQMNKLAQDMIRFNSSGGKAIAVARGIALTPKTTSYYFDIQTTDVCPCKCVKCWNYYEDDSGKKMLLKRNTDRSRFPDTDDFKRVVKEAIDLGIEQMTSTGGGEPFMNRNLADILEYAKAYSREQGKDVRIFVPTSGLGTVFNYDDILRKMVENIDLLRFSFDSLDEEFLRKSHGVTEEQSKRMIDNFRKVVDIKDRYGLKTDIEVLVLIYENNYSTIDYTIEKARELGATRILFNSITGKEDTLVVADSELKKASGILKSVFEKYCLGEYGDLKLDFDPVLMNCLESLPGQDADNLEPSIGDLRYCMKNVFGLTPVVTADGTFHVCFPCSQPFQANKKDIFKVGNIMDYSVSELVQKMRDQYRDINPKEDCISDCRDIPYFNAILRKIIDDELYGISPTSQPFLDRTAQNSSFIHSMHNEQFRESGLERVMDEYKVACRKVRNDQENEFREYVASIGENPDLVRSLENIPEGQSLQILSRYDKNLFEVHARKTGDRITLTSPELGKTEYYDLGKTGK